MVTINKIENLLNFIFIYKSLFIDDDKKLEVNLSYIEEKYDKLIGNWDPLLSDNKYCKRDSILSFLSRVDKEEFDMINVFENTCSRLSDIKEEKYSHVHPKIVEYTKNYIKYNQREINLLLLV